MTPAGYVQISAIQVNMNVKELQAIVDRFPVSADGVRIAPGQQLWAYTCIAKRVIRLKATNASFADADDSWDAKDICVAYSVCYTTKEAAEAAPRPTVNER